MVLFEGKLVDADFCKCLRVGASAVRVVNKYGQICPASLDLPPDPDSLEKLDAGESKVRV